MSARDILNVARWSRIALAFAALAVFAAAATGAYLFLSESRAQRPASVPQPVPELRFQDGQGKPRALSEFRGKVVLLNIWATWCVPCREEMPALDRVQQKLGGPNFEVVALSIDRGGAAAVRRFYEEIGIRALAVYVDPESEAVGKLRTVGVPTTLLVDREGREQWRKTGPEKWDDPAMLERLRGYFGAAPSAR